VKIARDVFAVPATGAGVERGFRISGTVLTKQRNRLITTIRDLIQYKQRGARHGRTMDEIVINTDMEYSEADE
jgi:hypothetical protein